MHGFEVVRAPWCGARGPGFQRVHMLGAWRWGEVDRNSLGPHARALWAPALHGPSAKLVESRRL